MSFFFFNDTATTEIYTLSLHDALPISDDQRIADALSGLAEVKVAMTTTSHASGTDRLAECARDRKSTRLNSSHSQISYAVFCLKKKIQVQTRRQVIDRTV